jgi:hypothetical protein
MQKAIRYASTVKKAAKVSGICKNNLETFQEASSNGRMTQKFLFSYVKMKEIDSIR